MKEIVSACLMYADQYNGRTPGSMWIACSWESGLGWTTRLAPYLGGKRKAAPTKGEHRVYQCPSAKNVDYSYGITDLELPNTGVVGGIAHSGGIILARLHYPSRQMLFYDLRPVDPGQINRNEAGQSNDLQQDGASYWHMSGKPDMINGQPGTSYNYCVYWPGVHGGNNFAHADGHVSYLTDWNSYRLTYTDSPPKS